METQWRSEDWADAALLWSPLTLCFQDTHVHTHTFIRTKNITCATKYKPNPKKVFNEINSIIIDGGRTTSMSLLVTN